MLNMLLQYMVQILLLLIRPELLQSHMLLQAICSVTLYGISMPLSLLFFLRCRQVQRPDRQKISKGVLFRLFCICMAGTYFCSMLGNYVNAIFSRFIGKEVVHHVSEMTSEMMWWEILL